MIKIVLDCSNEFLNNFKQTPSLSPIDFKAGVAEPDLFE